MNKTMTRENIVNKAWAERKPVCGTANNVMCATRWTPEQTPKNNHEKFDLTPEEHSYKTSVMWFRVFYLTTPTIRYCLTCISQWKLNFFLLLGDFCVYFIWQDYRPFTEASLPISAVSAWYLIPTVVSLRADWIEVNPETQPYQATRLNEVGTQYWLARGSVSSTQSQTMTSHQRWSHTLGLAGARRFHTFHGTKASRNRAKQDRTRLLAMKPTLCQLFWEHDLSCIFLMTLFGNLTPQAKWFLKLRKHKHFMESKSSFRLWWAFKCCESITGRSRRILADGCILAARRGGILAEGSILVLIISVH